MFRQYIRLALRNILKNRLFTFINIAGLALGIAGSLLVLLVIIDELSFDEHHENADRIYAVFQWWNFGNYTTEGASIAPAMGPMLEEEYPEVLRAVRFWTWRQPFIIHEDKRFHEERFAFADPEIFDVFTFSFISGDPQKALNEPYSVVLTSSTAEKYFGARNPVGEQISFWDSPSALVIANKAFNGNAFDLTVTGVIEDPPANTDLAFDFIASYATFGDTYEKELWSPGPRTYLLLVEDTSARQLEAKLPAFLDKYIGSKLEQAGQESKYSLIGLRDIRQHYTGGPVFVVVLAALGLIILIIASINFMNLSTARSAKRAKEVGVRKVVGANRSQLIGQFLGESIIMAIFALPLALVLAEFVLPQFNTLSGKQLALDFWGNAAVTGGILGIILLVGFMAGSYPALFLSRFNPERVLKGTLLPGRRSGLYRTLIVTQFTISILLLIAILILRQQVEFAQSKDLGFDKEQIVVIPNWSRDLVGASYTSFRNEILQNPKVLSSSVTSHYPGYGGSNRSYRPEGIDEAIRMDHQWGDHDFIKTFGFQLVAGREFSKGRQTDAEKNVIINETAVARFNWRSPAEAIGRSLDDGITVIGVVKDFHIFSLHREIGPAVIRLVPVDNLPEFWNNYFVAIKIHPQQISGTLEYLRKTWNTFFPDRPFVYSFLDEQFARYYEGENMVAKLCGLFSAIAIVIAALGLFGLAAYSAERRTKEVGIRKVLGSSVSRIVFLLTKEFVWLILIANLIAWPIAFIVISQLLQVYAYRVTIGILPFILVGAFTLFIALLTVCSQAIRAALANPITSLRYE